MMYFTCDEDRSDHRFGVGRHNNIIIVTGSDPVLFVVVYVV